MRRPATFLLPAIALLVLTLQVCDCGFVNGLVGPADEASSEVLEFEDLDDGQLDWHSVDEDGLAPLDVPAGERTEDVVCVARRPEAAWPALWRRPPPRV